MKTQTNTRTTTQNLVLSAMFLAVALVLPFLTGQIPQIGSMLCPMHIPVLLCGFFCGWPWGLLVGFIAPLLRHFIFYMPPMPAAAFMAFELAAYGAVVGWMYHRLPRSRTSIYLSLIAAMVLGRIVWGVARFIGMGLDPTKFGLAAFWAGAVTTAIPGIIVQLIVIPILVVSLDRNRVSG
ncbi:MAG: ECF transporter S component [Lachnospiraceae bacterium]|nr:ECF transporter S component [Lachnospiraceae bacterium]